MPQLPSGRHVSISPDNILRLAENGDFQIITNFYLHVHDRNIMSHLMYVVLYKNDENPPSSEQPLIGDPYISDLLVKDIETAKCDWPQQDKTAFVAWLQEQRTQEYLQSIYDQLFKLIKANKSPPPEALRGIFEDDF